MRLFLICLCLTSSLLARIECVNLDDYQNLIEQNGLEFVKSLLINQLKPVVEKQCLLDAGNGAKSACQGLLVKKCGGESNSKNGYLKVEMICDYCQGSIAKKEMEEYEKECKSQCRTSNRKCFIDDSNWDGAIVLPPGQLNECSSPLPNCSESSSSQNEESSSSEDLSSSSEESSSSVEESSSSEDGEESSGLLLSPVLVSHCPRST